MALFEDKRFIAHIAATAEKFNVPAISISLVDLSTGEATSKGFSFPPYEDDVTSDTVFQIYSNTKLFTAVAYGILAQEGKCAWNSKVCELLPGFKLQDETIQHKLTVEDLLTHQSGLSGHIMLEMYTAIVLANMQHVFENVRFAKPPKSGYSYCNLGAQLVGHIVSYLSGMQFADFVHMRILQPLGMLDTTWCDVPAGRKAVQGYMTIWKEDRLAEKIALPCVGLPRDNPNAASGSMLSTAADLTKWLAFLLRMSKGEATEADRSIVQPQILQEIVKSRVLATEQIGALPVEAGQSLWGEMSPSSYGFYQLRGKYRRIEIASHNGTGDGGGIVMLWTPEKDFGIFVLTNVIGSVFHAGVSIASTALDLHVKAAPIGWNSRVAAIEWAQNNRVPKFAKEKVGPGIPDATVICGLYEDVIYGAVRVVSLEGPSFGEDAEIEKILRTYHAAISFGKTIERKPTHLAVSPKTMGRNIFELYHAHDGCYRGVAVELIPRAGGDGIVLKVPTWVSFIDRVSRFDFELEGKEQDEKRMEFFKRWDNEVPVPGIGKGTVTLMRQG